MRFDFENLDDNHIYNFDDITNPETEIEAKEGEWIFIGVEAGGKVEIEVSISGQEERVQPTLQARAEGSESRNLFVNAYQIAKKGVYRVRALAERAAITVIKFGEDLADALRRVGNPTKATCSFCTKLLLIAIVLAFHHLAIPLAKHALGSYVVQHFPTAEAFMKALELSPAGKAVDFIYPAVERLFDDLKSIPESVRDPLGTLARKACRQVNLCSQAT